MQGKKYRASMVYFFIPYHNKKGRRSPSAFPEISMIADLFRLRPLCRLHYNGFSVKSLMVTPLRPSCSRENVSTFLPLARVISTG